jgi:hypothetical protein
MTTRLLGVLLPLTPANNYTPEILICGGSHISYVSKYLSRSWLTFHPLHCRDTLRGEQIDAKHDYASAQCSRLVLDTAGIAGGWKVEYMPEPRSKMFAVHNISPTDTCLNRPVLSDGVLLPNGKVLIVNGGRTGAAGMLSLDIVAHIITHNAFD